MRTGDDPVTAYQAVAEEMVVFVEVHWPNMSKRDADDRVLRGAGGKVLKGPGYRPPAFDDIVE